MEYIIFDLEWNNVYNYKTHKGLNEIIEIGALKLNKNLNVVDTFKQLIKPRLSKKLGSRFKNLTHITNEEIRSNGIDFDDAFADFARWCGNGDIVFLSWSTSDLYTLIANYRVFKKTTIIDFIKKYADAQQYCMHFIEGADNSKQISLSNCAKEFNINTENIALHRALEDCYITAYCFRKVYDRKIFEDFVTVCDVPFYERLIFKPYCISEPHCDGFDLSEVET
ncbi:MAG: exonuclease domain-containing protein, partial [Clostridiales bacterium]|nr:exonuclease domain-containing protein [Clostridiales bacterium]